MLDKRERPPCSIDPGTRDEDWIPEVAAQGLIVITRDRQIEQRTAEKAAVKEAGGRHVAITTKASLRKFEILEVVICQWRRLEDLSALPGPFIYGITRTSIRKLDDF